MVIQANSWGFKALARTLLLAPLLAGSLAVPAVAQTVRSSQPAATAPASDPKALLQSGRKALAAGDTDKAVEYAKAASLANGTGRWGLFADTPESLMKDAQAARTKADQAQAATYLKEARDLAAATVRSEAERLANLDAAADKVDRALLLGLAPDWNPFADKPEALKREIDANRAKLRKANPIQQTSARAATPATGGTKPARFELEVTGNTELASTPASGAKASAAKLIAEGRGLVAEGKLAEARKKFVDAAKTGATFALTEDNPDKGLQDVAAKGKEQVDGLSKMAARFSAEKDYVKAEAALTDAKATAESLGLWTRGIEIELEAVKKVLAPKAVPAAMPELPSDSTQVRAEKPATDVLDLGLEVPKAPDTKPAAKPAKGDDLPELPTIGDLVDSKPAAKPADLPKAIEVPMPTKTEPKVAPKVEPKVDAKAEAKKLLDEAATELKKGELDRAQKLAVQVNNAKVGLEDDAQKLMVMIDAERGEGKKKEALQTLEAATQAFNNKQYDYVGNLLSHIDPALLPKEKQAGYDALAKMSRDKLAAAKVAVVPASEIPMPSKTGELIPSTPTPGSSLAEKSKAAADLEYQALKAEAVQVQSTAIKAFDRGDTDVAVQQLSDFITKVKASKLAAARQRLLLDPVDMKLENFRLIKRQVDLYTKDAKDKSERLQTNLAKASASQQKSEEISKRVRDIKSLMAKSQFAEAEKLSLQAKTLDPDNETLNLIYELAKRNNRADIAKKIKDEREQQFLGGLNEADTVGPTVSLNDPVRIDIERARRNMGRGSHDETYLRPRTAVERDIEMKLDKPLKVEFKDVSLREVLASFRDTAAVNMTIDEQALAASGLDLDKIKVNEKITQPISLRSVMQVILEKNDLQHLVENNVIQVTTQKKAKGRMHTKVFSVMELVTPIPDYAVPETSSLEKTFQRLVNPQQPWVNSQVASTGGLGGGQMVGTPWGGTPTVTTGVVPGSGGILQNQSSAPPASPIGNLNGMAATRTNYSDQLMKLIKGMVRPNTWEDGGGAGKVSYYDIGGALVVNQTADVITEVNNLLESLRRLQDLSVAVEVRIISLSESFFERIGVDFQMNIKTKDTGTLEQQIFTGVFRPTPFLNDISTKNVITGWNPASGGFTPDLDVPIRPNTYGFSAPPFGGYPGNGNGGLNLGLAFLNDIQVFMFLEASAGDRRANVMQAPKVTVLNGGGVFIQIQDTQFFTLGLQVFNVGGQFVYLPQNTPTPIGISLFIQATVSSDRRFVRLAVNPTLTELTSATVPLFPVTAFITPVFEGGSQGTPIPFTQFFQQPSFSSISIQTNVVVPDGGTVLMGGLKTMSEGRNEFGPPVLSNIPYLNRLFRNTGIGRETKHMMIMVTPRIIITTEEEAVQTGAAQSLGAGN